MKKSTRQEVCDTFGWKLVMQPRKDYTCFGCGKQIKHTKARHTATGELNCPNAYLAITARKKGGTTQTVRFCLICSMLAALADAETGGAFRQNQFERHTMANCNKKRYRAIRERLLAGENAFEMLKSFLGMETSAQCRA